jgi:hypothetical protein
MLFAGTDLERVEGDWEVDHLRSVSLLLVSQPEAAVLTPAAGEDLSDKRARGGRGRGE